MNHSKRDSILNIEGLCLTTLGQKVKVIFFSEHGHVAYQIKWNHECSNMVSNILPAYSAPTLRVWSKVKIQPFQNMLHIKIKGIIIS